MQIGTSIGLALTSSMASSVSSHALARARVDPTQPDAEATDPAVLMPGFRAAAWMCLGASALSFVIALVRLRGMGVVGALKDEQDDGQGQGQPELSLTLGAVEEVKAHAPVPVSVPVTMPGDVDAGAERKSREDVDVEAQQVQMQMQSRRSRSIDNATNSTPSAQA